jgi:type IV secretory pathway VirB3-like protein
MADDNDFEVAKDDYVEGVRNRRIFTSAHLIFGMPANLAIGGVALAIGVFFVSTWWAAIIVALIYLPPMIAIHKDDARAFQVWQTMIRERTSGWEAGNTAKRILVVLDT